MKVRQSAFGLNFESPPLCWNQECNRKAATPFLEDSVGAGAFASAAGEKNQKSKGATVASSLPCRSA